MDCFEKKDYCTDEYHKQLVKQKGELENLHFNVYQLELEIVDTFPEKYLRNKAELEEIFKQEQELKNRKRETASCPGFSNQDFIGKVLQKIFCTDYLVVMPSS